MSVPPRDPRADSGTEQGPRSHEPTSLAAQAGRSEGSSTVPGGVAEQPTTGEHIRRNTRSSVVTFVFLQGLRFLLFPIVIAYLQEGYALVNVAFVFFGYFTVYDFGINTAYLRYTADCHARRDYARLTRLFSTGVAVCAVAGVVTFAAVVWWIDDITGFFNIAPEYYDTAKFVIIFVGFVAMITVVLGVYRAALSGLQRLDLVNNSRVVFSIVEFVTIVALLYSGFRVRTVVVVYGITLIGPFLLMYYFVRRHLPEVRIQPLRPSRDALRSLFSVGGRMQFLGVLALLVAGLDRLVVLRYEALAFTAAYVIARALVDRLQMIPMQGFGALIAASADLHSREDQKKIGMVFASALRLTAVVTAYIFAFTAVNNDLVVLGYIGPLEYSKAASSALLFLSLAAIVHTCTGPGSSMLRGACEPFLESMFHFLTLAGFGVVFYVGYRYERNDLIVMAYPAAIGLSSVLFVFLANRRFHAPLFCPFSSAFLPIAGAFGVAWCIRLAWNLLPIGPGVSRWTIALSVLAMGGVHTLLFAPLAWFVPGLTAQDKDQLVRFVPGGTRILKMLGMKQPLPIDPV